MYVARFCFGCISEWAAVENRCPFCKVRFATIRRTCVAGTDDATVLETVSVPERDQVRLGGPRSLYWPPATGRSRR